MKPDSERLLSDFSYADDESAANAVRLKYGADNGVFVIEGPAGCGKTTLARTTALQRGYAPSTDRTETLAIIEGARRMGYTGIALDNVNTSDLCWPVLVEAGRFLRIVITTQAIYIPRAVEGRVALIQLVPRPKVTQ